ncbi:MAG: phosphodiester glycosidase family protein [Muribaculaceae bacterium]|nr:phosphodiester glycosidase family protein [Muribaculaceae bacterium]
MKRIALSTATILSASLINLSAATQWTIGNAEYKVDTLYHATVGPGTTETELRIESIDTESPVVNNIYYTVTDLNNQYVEMRAAKAGNHLRMLETVPDIAERMNKPGERYFAGVNADFFNTHFPYNGIGLCVANGFLTNYETDGADIDPYYIIFDEKGVPAFARHVYRAWEGYFQFPDGKTCAFHLNAQRWEDEMLLYTPSWQSNFDGRYGNVGYTGTNSYGVEVKLRPVGDNVLYGNRLKFEVVEDPEEAIGNMKIPEDGYVLSGHGSTRDFLRKLKKGDIITSWISFQADGLSTQAKEVLGGFPRILTKGATDKTLSYPEHLSGPEPRSAVGYNADKSKLFMAVVDGRNAGGSHGVSQSELAAIMRYIGCSDAMNFDGGGSSTMYVDGLGVKNVPSTSSLDKDRPEGAPRVVVNALFAVAVAPVDNVIASIEIRDKKVALSSGETYTPVVYGYNQYGVLVSPDVTGYTIKVPEKVGQVNGNVLTASDGHFSSHMTVEYNGAEYSVPLYINGGGEFITTAINEVSADLDSTVEYYQLNGIRTAAPAPGQITVTRRGGSATKELNR